jgi:tetratricopeptide (TPR) repeat protein
MRYSSIRGVHAFLVAVALAVAVPVQAQDDPITRARASFDARRYAEARALLEPTVKAQPRNAAAHFWLGRALFAEQRWEDAAKSFERAIALEESRSDYHLWLGNAAGQQAQRANKLKQPFLAKKVQREFERAVQLDPASVDAREGLVDFYSIAPGVMGGSMDKAREQVREISRLAPFRGHLLTARLALRQKDSAGAERALTSAVAQFPDSSSGYAALANWYASANQLPKAFETLDALLARKPNDMAARYAWARLAATSGQQLDRAEQFLRAYLDYTPAPNEASHAGAHYRLGMIQEKRRKLAEALAEYELAARMDPSLKGAADAAKRLRK